MDEVVFWVEPESSGGRWRIRRNGRVRAAYASRAQAVMDARQLASFECELRGALSRVRVLDERRELAEDFVCDIERSRAVDGAGRLGWMTGG